MASDDGLGRAIARDLEDDWRYDVMEDEEQMMGYAEDDGMTKLTQWVMRYQHEIEQLPHQVVEALEEAMELTRHEMDEQSAQVLAVLHDKDVRIREFEALLAEKEAENTKSTRTIAIQAEDVAQGKPDMVDQSVQCDDQVGQAQLQAMAIRLEVQHEQIQVLSDDVDRYRLEAASLRSLHERAVATTTAQTTQTDEEVAAPSPDQALRVMAALRRQLERVEAHNRELQALLERLETERNATQSTSEDAFVAIERELTKAVHSMTDSTSCAVVGLFSDPLPCVNLAHHLEKLTLERDHLRQTVQQLRRSLLTGERPDRHIVNDSPSTSQEPKCPALILRALDIVRRCRIDQPVAKEQTKALKKQLMKALEKRSRSDAAKIIADVSREWMGWEANHVSEIQTVAVLLHSEREAFRREIGHFAQENQRLEQEKVGLQAQINALRSACGRQSGEMSMAVASKDRIPPSSSNVGRNRRVLQLEHALQVKNEQIWVANRTIQALSTGSFTDQHGRAPASLAILPLTDQVPVIPPSNNVVSAVSAQLQSAVITPLHEMGDELPSCSTGFTSVTEFFAIEKEALRLRHQLHDCQTQIKSLESELSEWQREYRVLNTKRVTESLNLPKTSTSTNEWLESVERQRLFLVERQNQELVGELIKARTHLKLNQSRFNSTESQKITRKLTTLINRLEKHHMEARSCLKEFKQTQKSASPSGSAQQMALEWAKSLSSKTEEAQEHLMVSLKLQELEFGQRYAVLFTQYDDLCVHLHEFLGQSCTEDTARVALRSWCLDSEKMVENEVERLVLFEKIQLLEQRVLEVQSRTGKNSGGTLVEPIFGSLAHFSAITSQKRLLHASTQTDATYERISCASSVKKSNRSIATQVALLQSAFQQQIVPLRGTSDTLSAFEDGSRHQDESTAGSRPDMSKTNTTRAIQAELDASLGRIAELTALSDQLQAKLHFSKKLHRQQAKDKEQLQVQLDASTSTNASLAEQLARCQQELFEKNDKARTPKTTSTPSSQESSLPSCKPGTTADALQLQLSAREQENLELVRQLCEIKAKCFEAENARLQLESKCREMELNAQQHRQETAKNQVSHLESYMEKINTTLAKIEHEKIKLSEENETLKRQVQSLTQELTAKQIVTSSMRSCGTETEATRELEHLRALPEYQEMETRFVLLKNQLDGAQQRYEGLQRTIETERTRRSEEEKKQFQSVQDEKAKYEALMDELRDAYEAVQNESAEFQAASTEAHEESEKRIVYLTRCVEECSRLVDSDGSFSTRDIYDKIVNLSKNLVNLRPTPALATKKKAKASGPAMVSSRLGASKRDKRDLLAMDEALKDKLQVETWRLRAAKLEEALRAAKLQNKTFEDMVNQLEDQMEGVKVEIKDRMTKEAALLNKQNNAKMEAANAKVQCATLTSRLAEACGELKRNQETALATEKELVRVRAALQRKTELLTSQKQKKEVLERELEKRTQRLLQLEGVEKNLLGMQQKQKDQVLAIQELRQQCNTFQDMHFELTRQVESEKNQVTSLQTRIKGLRQENGLLREQVKSQTKRVVEAAVEKEAKASHSKHTGPGATEVVNPEQIKSLKRRVLQKQEVIIAQKTKIASLEAQVTTQQTRLLALTQSQRMLQETQRLTQQSMLQGVEDIKTELEASVATRVEELDGLRASLYDACEVFVHCRAAAPSKKANKADTNKRDPWSSTSDSSATASMRSYMHPEDDEDPNQSRVRTEILSELRHYAHLSAHDLEDLNIVDGTRRGDSTEDRHHGRRIQEELWTRKQAQRVLEELEHALEVTPQDCRTEICQVLEFLCGPETKVSSVKHARRY